ncbi:hypothetical protein Ddc_23933 [Ditylenchus destructor]|nr:hypothetical protein Ddc_23933 [Ditylenchus destructor]
MRQNPRLPALRLAEGPRTSAVASASRTIRAIPSTPCSIPASASRARSSRPSIASRIPRKPRFDGERVHLPQATHEALAAYVGSGMLAAAQDHEHGGMQLPCVVEMAANCFFSKASVAMGGYAMLTNGNANL